MEKPPVRVLLVEDNPGDARLLRETLAETAENKFDLTHVADFRTAVAHLAERPYALVLLDISLPDAHGLETVTRLRINAPAVPIVVLTGLNDESFALHAVREGAQDYLVKGQINSQLLVRAMNYAIERHRLLTERQNLEAQLRQSQRLESVGKLAGGIAHDFNNLLTIIYGHASLLTEPAKQPADLALCAQRISAAAERAANLTRQLLMFSRKQPMQPRTLDLRQVVGGIVKMLQPFLGEDITLRVEHPANLPMVFADSSMMEQVIMNLALNARDAMPKGGALTIRTAFGGVGHATSESTCPTNGSSTVCLTVTDTGHGIAPEILPHIFEPFYTTKDASRGTGLGLATVYGIVKQHQGWIQVASEVGTGTTFEIHLPVSSEPKDALIENELARPVPRGSETVLIVEDEPPLRQLLRFTLESQGYTVLEAESGRTALGVWRDHRGSIDLLLTDIVMPGGLTGWELADHLKSERPDLKVLLTSGYNKEIGGREAALRKGFHFVPKPYRPAEVACAVRECLDGRGVSAPIFNYPGG